MRPARCTAGRFACPLKADGMTPGSCFAISSRTLVTGHGDVFDFSASPAWQATKLQPGKAVGPSELPEIVSATCRSLSPMIKPDGWASLIPLIEQRLNGYPLSCQSDFEKPMPKLVWPAVVGMILASQVQDINQLMEAAAVLVGLGEGLTPSGDDFLGGYFFCIHLLSELYPELKDWSLWNYLAHLKKWDVLTNPISYSLLIDHAEGHALEPLHRFANALLQGQSTAQLLGCAAELTAVGHSSGWDMLTGFLAGMTVTC